MLNKIKTYELLPHVIGSIIGAFIGLIFGLFVTDQSDQYEELPIEVEVPADD